MPPAVGSESVQQRISDLESHLEQENPILLNAVQGFRRLDSVAYEMNLLETNKSFASQIPWWPLISILGTFSAGKSTFINSYLGQEIQRTGNQAVDDRFTVVVYSPEEKSHALPGVSLDSDPRFPFYQMSREIERVAGGEGKRIDAYLQLKTCRSERLRGKILIDSPGFDADAQRTAILSLTNHMIDLSDLVLVFFDARHPEPGAMRDTLKHLVGDTMVRSDSSKFLYILNQMDSAAREDNPEDVVAAWLRSLGEVGLTTGRFYTIYNRDVSTPITDPARRKRFEEKRDRDLADIDQRMDQVEIERAYRIIATLRKTATALNDETIPLLSQSVSRWRTRTLLADGAIFAGLAFLFLFWSITAGHWQGLHYQPGWLKYFEEVGINWGLEGLEAGMILLLIAAHFGVRKLMVVAMLPGIKKKAQAAKMPGDPAAAFVRNTRSWRPLLTGKPLGCNQWSEGRIAKVLHDCEAYVQSLNERFTNPKGIKDPATVLKAQAGEQAEGASKA
ncbi:dynamin family protein [Thiorhodovibrio frisius]|uniref:Dynamin family protein n=1 Tax=Thiorhodovibrio frisius TaxID=631362 RepID=H8Z5H5_9GAMM|nr:dynamin family protein [Thiorhodovibrio frisius]EIC19521.1 dynamin family protein [Thiorhodovibrio frisius]WPL20516.1 putative GTPase [Thiorhodovibrio frisius]